MVEFVKAFRTEHNDYLEGEGLGLLEQPVFDRTSHRPTWSSKHLWPRIRNVGSGPENKVCILADRGTAQESTIQIAGQVPVSKQL